MGMFFRIERVCVGGGGLYGGPLKPIGYLSTHCIVCLSMAPFLISTVFRPWFYAFEKRWRSMATTIATIDIIKNRHRIDRSCLVLLTSRGIAILNLSTALRSMWQPF